MEQYSSITSEADIKPWKIEKDDSLFTNISGFSFGPSKIGGNSIGKNLWRYVYINNRLVVNRDGSLINTLITTIQGSEATFSFDKKGKSVYCIKESDRYNVYYKRDNEDIKITLPLLVTSTRLTLDPLLDDVVLTFIENNRAVYCSYLSEGFLVNHLLTKKPNISLLRVGSNTNNRIQFLTKVL